MNKKWIAAMLAAGAMTLSAGAMAQQMDSGWYVGGAFGQADLGPDEDTAWKISGGYQLNRTFSAEIGYTNLGEIDVPGGSAEATAWELIALGKFPVANQFSVYGLVGFANVEGEATVGGITVSDDSTELTYGIGAQFDVSRNLGIRAQWQRYDTDDEIDVMSLGVVWKF